MNSEDHSGIPQARWPAAAVAFPGALLLLNPLEEGEAGEPNIYISRDYTLAKA